MDGQRKQPKRGRGRPPKNPDLTPEQRDEQRLKEKREYSRRPEVKQKRRERDDKRNTLNNLIHHATGSLNLVTTDVTGGIKSLIKAVERSSRRSGTGKSRKASKRREPFERLIEGNPLTIPEEEDDDFSMPDVSSQRLLAGNVHHNRVSDSESLQLQHDDGDGFDDEDDISLMSDITAFSNATMISHTTGMSSTTAVSNRTMISLRNLYTDEEIAKIHATIENGSTVWTIHIMERMFQRSIFESAIFKALQAGAYKPDGKSGSNIKVIHNDLVVIINVKPDCGTCHLITTFRIGSSKGGENFGRKPINNPDDIKRFELCRSIFMEQLEKVQSSEKQQQREIIELRRQLQLANEKLQSANEEKEYYKWRCNRQEKDEIVFGIYFNDEEQRDYQRNKRSIDDYDGQFMTPTKRSKRSTEAPWSAPHYY